MNTLKKRHVFGIFVGTILCLTALHFLQDRMEKISRVANLTTDELTVDAPPLVAFVQVAGGAFRGVVADLLFLRAQKMQEAENYFELVQLSSWIVKLQPRFTGATAFLAWNMAYNISVTQQGYADRWRWVQRGIELIRDEALFYNPDDPLLYRELGWFYQHKLGQNLDDANRYYKYQMANDFIAVLGNDRHYDWEALGAAPVDEAGLHAALGEIAVDSITRLIDSHGLSMGQVIATYTDTGQLPVRLGQAPEEAAVTVVLTRALDTRPDGPKPLLAAARDTAAERFNEILASFKLNHPQLELEFRKQKQLPEDIALALEELGWRDKVRNHLQRRWLQKDLNLDPEYIAMLIREYGYLDFRLPEAHAVYWARKGLEHAENNASIDCERMIFQSLNDAYFNGFLLHLSPDPKKWWVYYTTNNTALVDSARNAYLDAAENHPDNRSVKSGFENFMVDAIVTLYVGGQRKKATEFLLWMRSSEWYGTSLRYHQTLEHFAFTELQSDVDEATQDQAETIVQGFLTRSFTSLALGQQNEAAGFAAHAGRVYETYMQIIKKDRDNKRRGLRPFDYYRTRVLSYLLGTGSMEPELQAWLRFELKRWAAEDSEFKTYLSGLPLSENLVSEQELADLRETSTQVCAKCGRAMPITAFERLEGRAGRARSCRICEKH
tara:strand:- start:932 stop:2929 length:1998 start_codon:yes stop_codon:yes gene_type:complete